MTEPRRRDAARPGQRRSAGSRGRTSEPQPLVVGGEGEIDYDDGDDSIVTTARPAVASPRAGAETSEAAGAGHKRRRRRGRGKGRAPQRADGPLLGDESASFYDEDELVTTSREPLETNGDEEPFDDDLEAVVDPRRQPPQIREPKRYGPVRQLYGRPVKFDEPRPQHERPRRDDATTRERGGRSQTRGRAPSRQVAEDDLDLVIKPKSPAPIRVEVRDEAPSRRKVPDDRRGRGEGRPRRDRADGEGGRRFGRAERPSRSIVKREGPAVRQLYPPPNSDVERPHDAESEGPPKPGFGRRPRGPLMRAADSAPVPKGKVRQLYPPPEPSEEPGGSAASVEAEAYDRVVFDEAGDEAESSVFISDAEELEDRRRRARERAESRRRAQAESLDSGESPEQPGAAPSFEPSPAENDEWPVF